MNRLRGFSQGASSSKALDGQDTSYRWSCTYRPKGDWCGTVTEKCREPSYQILGGTA